MSARSEIQWTPITNKFITWSSEVCLYEIEPFRETTTTSLRLSDTTNAQLLATNSNYHYIKCLDIYPKSDHDILLAIGQANGKVTLTTFGPSQFDSQGLPGRELVPRHPRQCNAVVWNPVETNIIAAGLEKYRSDHSILLWDITKCPQQADINGSTRLSNSSVSCAVELARPVAEFGLSETAHSLAWFGNVNSKLMAGGINLKTIKLVDFRDTSKAVNSTQTKAVFGLCIDPFNDKHLASYIDNQVFEWDIRNFEKPIVILTHNKPIVKIGWCPTRHNLLGALQREASSINLYDIQHTIVANEEVEPSVLERIVTPRSSSILNSFCWHGSDENRLLTTSLTGMVTDYTVFDRITLNWAPNFNMVWTYGRKTMKCINDSKDVHASWEDISHKIKRRALSGYGLKNDFLKNGELSEDEQLMKTWHWLYLSNKLVIEGILRGYNSKHPGVRSILKMDGVSIKSDMVVVSWSEIANANCYSTARTYIHEDREKALHLCGWNFEKDTNALVKFLEQLEKEQEYARAATIAVFNLKIKLALEILNRGSDFISPDSNLSIVAMALAGFSDDKSSMWRQLCGTTRAQLKNPYLRAMFAFLTADNYIYDNVLNENGMSVADRVAFACIFLPDIKLQEYLKNLVMELINEGNLDGILLTGNSGDGIRLLQRFLDTTGDIQTTALIGVQIFPGDLIADTIKDWIQSYRNLLDSWKLWNERAHFDIMLSAHRPGDKPMQQVYVSCSFCGKSISAYMQGLNRGRGPFSRITGTTNKIKMNSCPHCRKPLPRCAICLMHLGTAMGDQTPIESDNSKLTEFSHWFAWCQSCRHGGHASHIIHWFKEHSECPVTPCTCRCFSADAVCSEIYT